MIKHDIVSDPDQTMLLDRLDGVLEEIINRRQTVIATVPFTMETWGRQPVKHCIAIYYYEE